MIAVQLHSNHSITLNYSHIVDSLADHLNDAKAHPNRQSTTVMHLFIIGHYALLFAKPVNIEVKLCHWLNMKRKRRLFYSTAHV